MPIFSLVPALPLVPRLIWIILDHAQATVREPCLSTRFWDLFWKGIVCTFDLQKKLARAQTGFSRNQGNRLRTKRIWVCARSTKVNIAEHTFLKRYLGPLMHLQARSKKIETFAPGLCPRSRKQQCEWCDHGSKVIYHPIDFIFSDRTLSRYRISHV